MTDRRRPRLIHRHLARIKFAARLAWHLAGWGEVDPRREKQP